MGESERTRIRPLTRAALAPRAWLAACPVRFGHCDAAGIVFTPRYFDLLNEAVERFFTEALGVDYYGLLTGRRIGLGYVQAHCDFLRPSRMGEVLDIAVLVERIGTRSYTLLMPILKDGTEVARGRLVTAPTSLDTLSSVPIPPDIRDALAAYQDRCGGAPALP